MRVYMDNGATTRVTEPVMAAMQPYFCEIFGNPSSIHGYGREARRAVEAARAQVAKALNAQPREIYFTGCGTESDNWAIRGAAYANVRKGRHIITTNIEHHAVLHTCKQLEKEGFEVTYLPVDHDGLVTPEQLEAAVTERTKAIIINSPNNPTGNIWPRELLAAACELARKHDFFIVSDEIYEDLCYDGYSQISPAQISDDAKQRTILVSGFSKAYAMTGWRMGYASGPLFAIKAMGSIQSHMTGNPNSITQYAALTALTASQDCVVDMAHSFARRRTLLLFLLAQNGLRPGVMPKGAFYMLLDVRHYLGKKCGDVVIDSDLKFAQMLLEKAFVAVIPGAPFGADGFVRMSYAVSDIQITEAVRRISSFVQSLE